VRLLNEVLADRCDVCGRVDSRRPQARAGDRSGWRPSHHGPQRRSLVKPRLGRRLRGQVRGDRRGREAAEPPDGLPDGVLVVRERTSATARRGSGGGPRLSAQRAPRRRRPRLDSASPGCRTDRPETGPAGRRGCRRRSRACAPSVNHALHLLVRLAKTSAFPGVNKARPTPSRSRKKARAKRRSAVGRG
jgi:hypothetical protein